MQQWVYLKDNFVPEQQATLSFRDLAIQRGYGIFDFMRVSGNRILFAEQHLERFYASAEEMHLPVKQSRENLLHIIETVASKNNLPESGIRLTLTGGESADGYSIAEPNLIISQHLFSMPDDAGYSKGIRLVTYEHQRQLPQVKTIDYAKAIWLQPYIREHGGDDVLYHHGGGAITECPRANFFLINSNDELVTPKDFILRGITRANILQLANDNAYQVKERKVNLSELKSAKAAFITSTTKRILPVSKIDDTTFRTDHPLMLKLSKALTALHLEQIHHAAE
jgi:D-alanine transaminase/branched-chain amino acid aminotransferase